MIERAWSRWWAVRSREWGLLCCAACALLLSGGLLACAGQVQEAEDSANPDPVLAAATEAALSGGLRCEPEEVIECPCPGGGRGRQRCDDSGMNYGVCRGCSAVVPSVASSETVSNAGPASGSEPTGDPGLASSAAAVMGEGVAGAINPMASIEVAGIEADADDGMADVLQTEALGLAPAGASPGVSCGVGLPLLCASSEEKCCIRSLRTDTCIDINEACECDLPECTTTTAACDGPEDCVNGQKCCGTTRAGGLPGAGTYENFSCSADCSGRTRWEACHEGEGTCPSGLICANSQLLTNLQICISADSIQQ